MDVDPTPRDIRVGDDDAILDSDEIKDWIARDGRHRNDHELGFWSWSLLAAARIEEAVEAEGALNLLQSGDTDRVAVAVMRKRAYGAAIGMRQDDVAAFSAAKVETGVMGEKRAAQIAVREGLGHKR